MRCEFTTKPGQIESCIDLPHQMIFRNRVVELKLVEKLRLFALQPTHHASPPPRFASARWNHCSPHASTDFCNKICQWQTSSRRLVGLGNTGLGAALEDDGTLSPGNVAGGREGGARFILVVAAQRQQALAAQTIDLRQIEA